jgi:hypothetical protein
VDRSRKRFIKTWPIPQVVESLCCRAGVRRTSFGISEGKRLQTFFELDTS